MPTSMARLTSVLPSCFNSCLGSPIRDEAPAAKMIKPIAGTWDKRSLRGTNQEYYSTADNVWEDWRMLNRQMALSGLVFAVLMGFGSSLSSLAADSPSANADANKPVTET